MQGRSFRIALTFVLACTVCAAQAGAESARRLGSLDFKACTLAQAGLPVTVAAQCASLSVPEDRAQPAARRIDVAIAWVPSTAKKPRPDPVVMLAGGPGQSALEAFPLVAAAFRGVLRERHVLLVDQRGTGRSHPLECVVTEEAAGEELLEADYARELAASCLAEIGDGADPRHYTTSDYIADLEDVRTALEVERWNLVGVSYGTRVALEYLRRQPQRTRTLTLDSVVPPGLILGAEHARNLDAAIDAHFARCDADPVCHERYGSPRARLDALLERLRRQPARVSYQDPVTSTMREDELTADAVASVVRLYAYAPQLFGMLPMTLAAAADGEYATLMAQARMIEDLVGEQISAALQLSVSCAEDAPWLEADPADANTLMGTAFVDSIVAQCTVWPRGRMPDDFHEPVESALPVLLLSGEFDPVTPPRYGEEVLKTLPGGRHFVLRGQGHGTLMAGCVPELLTDFISQGNAVALDDKCLDRLIHAPPFGGTYGWEP